jgi:hypothetical protein
VLFLLFRAHSVLRVCFLSEFGLHRFLETDTQGGTSSLPLLGVAAVSTVLCYPSSLKSRHSGLVLRIFGISHPPLGSNSDPRKHDRFATKRPFPGITYPESCQQSLWYGNYVRLELTPGSRHLLDFIVRPCAHRDILLWGPQYWNSHPKVSSCWA